MPHERNFSWAAATAGHGPAVELVIQQRLQHQHSARWTTADQAD